MGSEAEAQAQLRRDRILDRGSEWSVLLTPELMSTHARERKKKKSLYSRRSTQENRTPNPPPKLLITDTRHSLSSQAQSSNPPLIDQRDAIPREIGLDASSGSLSFIYDLAPFGVSFKGAHPLASNTCCFPSIHPNDPLAFHLHRPLEAPSLLSPAGRRPCRAAPPHLFLFAPWGPSLHSRYGWPAEN